MSALTSPARDRSPWLIVSSRCASKRRYSDDADDREHDGHRAREGERDLEADRQTADQDALARRGLSRSR